MRWPILSLLLVTGCSGSAASPDPSAGGDASFSDAGPDSAASGDDSAAATGDAGGDAADASCGLTVDDAGVTHGCNRGGHGPGDHDDGGDAAPAPPPDAARDASNLPLGAPCWDSAQCASDMCFDYAVRGTFCSRLCATNADCPPPSAGCNGMGVCREGN